MASDKVVELTEKLANIRKKIANHKKNVESLEAGAMVLEEQIWKEKNELYGKPALEHELLETLQPIDKTENNLNENNIEELGDEE